MKYRSVYMRGMITFEYAVLIAVFVGALIAMLVYFKRGLQGRYRGQVDGMSGAFYSPKETIAETYVFSQQNESSAERFTPGYSLVGQGLTNSVEASETI